MEVSAQEKKLQVYTEEYEKTSATTLIPKKFSVTSIAHAKKIADSLLYTFQFNGYIDALRTRIQKRNDSTLTTRFRLKRKYDSIQLDISSTSFTPSDLSSFPYLKTDSTQISLPFEKLRVFIDELITVRMNEGDPFSSFSIQGLKKNAKKTISGNLRSTNPTPRTIDTIVVKGYEKVPRAYLSQVANFKKGNVFNYAALIEGAENLAELPTISQLRSPEVKFEQDKTEVYVYLEKKSVNTFDGLLGFSNNNEENKLRLDGYANIRLINNLNYAEDLSISYKSDGDDQERITVNLALPYLFNSGFGLNGSLDLFRRDSTFSSNRQKFNGTYQINPKLNVYSGYEKFSSEDLNDTTQVSTSVEDLTARFLSLGASFTGRRIKNLLRNYKSFITLEGNFGERQLIDQAEDQMILNLSAWHYIKLNSKNFIYLKNESSWIESESYVTNELKRFGGILSLRGFEENSIDASIYTTTQTEYIHLLSPSLFINSIFDVAYYQNEVLNTEDQLYSVGIGLGLNTQTGLLRLNLANGKAADQNFKFSNSKVHISLIANF